jgi:hypothetical protein
VGSASWAIAAVCGCLLLTAIVLPVGYAPVIRSQSGGDDNCRYFARTGHRVCDEFLEYFDTRGGLEIFGYPLSETFEDAAHDNLWVQYFQRARMEWHPSNPVPYQVQLGLLIDEMGYAFPPVPAGQIPAPDDPENHYFPETQHVVSYAFLDAYREKGGLDIFGYPRSEFMYEDGKVVQYFQRARMEWDRSSVQQPISLTNIGEMYLQLFPIARQYRERVAEDRLEQLQATRPAARFHTIYLPLVLANSEAGGVPSTSVPVRPTATAEASAQPTPTPDVPVKELRISPSVRYPITGQRGIQTVFIYVNDQVGRPIAGATAQVVVHYPQRDQDCKPQPTDSAGFTWCSFDILSPTPGKKVLIDIDVAYGELTATTQISFMPWW